MIGEVSALITAFLWSGSSMLFSAATARVGSLYVNITRLIVAALILTILVDVLRLEISVSSQQCIYLAISGMIGLVFGDSFLFRSYQYNGARISMLIMSFSPAISAIAAYFWLEETISLTGIAGMCITLGGIVLVVFDQHQNMAAGMKLTATGLMYGFLGAVGQAGGLIFARQAFNLGPVNGILAAWIRVSLATAVIVPVMILAGKYRHPIKIFKDDRKALYHTLAGSALGPILGITFSLIAVANAKVGIAATLMSTMPIMMLPMVKFFSHEHLTNKAVIGALIAVGGVALLFMG